MRKDINKRKNEILDLYNQNFPIFKISNLMKCDFSVVKRILKKNNVKIRPLSFYIKGKPSPLRIIKNEQKVIDMYLKGDIPGDKIAKHFKCDNSVIYDILNKHNIKIKGNNHFLKGKPPWNKGIEYKKYFDNEKATKIIKNISEATKKVMENESHRKRLGEIRKKGYEEGRIKKFIGEENYLYGKPQCENLKKGIEKHLSKVRNKTLEEIHGKEKAKNIKKKSSATKQGIPLNKWEKFTSFEPYGPEFDKKLKKLIKERDGCCMICKVGFEDLKLLKRRIHIHHINYDKQCNLLPNLISLCAKCHGLTNQNRKHWIKHFQSLLTEMYNYQYSETGEIILNLNAGG